MDDYTRENVVGWGQAAASYAIFKANSNMGTAAIENAALRGIVEGEHTRFIVTQRTGDVRLGRQAALGAQARTTGMWLAVFGAPFVLFMVGVGIHVAMGSPTTGAGVWFGPLWLVLCLVLFGFLAHKTNHTEYRNQYTRANLPSERELNRSGYWQVEPDVWFNPITQAVLTGHAYSGQEAAQGRRSYRDDSQAIRALYRQQKGAQAPQMGTLPRRSYTKTRTAAHHVPKRTEGGWTGLGR